MFDLSQSKTFLQEFDDQLSRTEALLARAQQPGVPAPPPPAPPPPAGDDGGFPGFMMPDPKREERLKLLGGKEALATIQWSQVSDTLYKLTSPRPAIVTEDGLILMEFDHLYEIDKLGEQAAAYIAYLDKVTVQWEKSVEVVRKATTQSAADLKKVEAARPDMHKNVKGDDFNVVKEYMEALNTVRDYENKINTAVLGLHQAASQLKADSIWQEKARKEDEIQKTEAQVKDLEKKKAEARAILTELFDIAEKVVKMDWAGLTTKAINYVKGEIFEEISGAPYNASIKELKAKLGADKTKLAKLNLQGYAQNVETARLGVEKALSNLEDVKNELKTKLKSIRLQQRQTTEVFAKSKSTAFIGAILKNRTQQLKDIEQALARCQELDRAMGEAGPKVHDAFQAYYGIKPQKILVLPGQAADSVIDSVWDLAQYNASKLQPWLLHAGFLHSENDSARAWLAYGGKGGPMEHFEKAMEVIQTTLGDPD